MQGYLLTFFTQQGRRHGKLPMGEWLVQEARSMGVTGATLLAAAEGFGHDRTLHSARFFELGDQPIEVMMAVSATDADRIFERLRQEGIDLFYLKAPIEFGMTSDV